MSGETYLTLLGNLTAKPNTGVSRNGDAWTQIRVASTPRRFDTTEKEYRDGATIFMNVKCWRALAVNVASTFEKGDRVLVFGKLRPNDYEDSQGVKHTSFELDAESVSPDLLRVSAHVMRRPAAAGSAPAVSEDGDREENAPEESPFAHDAPEPEPALA